MTGIEFSGVTSEHARCITDQIKVAVEGAWLLIREAYESRAWQALGYSNWDDYCTREFGSSRLRLPREERTEVVQSLRDAGLSIRAIESATGLSHGTVHAEICTAQNRPVEPAQVVGINGKRYQPTQPHREPVVPQKRARRPIGLAITATRREAEEIEKRLGRFMADDRFESWAKSESVGPEFEVGHLRRVAATLIAFAEKWEAQQ